MTRPRVAILHGFVHQYRVPFYDGLNAELARRGVDLQLIHGDPVGEIGHAGDQVVIPWADHISNRHLQVMGKGLYWQPALGLLDGADLVIVEQASSRLINYVLLAEQLLGRTKVAFWGHGKDWRPGRFAAIGEGLKRITSRRAHWWFAYNDAVVDIVADLGYPRDRITNTNNAVDTTSLQRAHDALDQTAVATARSTLGIPAEDRVALFCGAMYPDKRLDFIVAAADHVRLADPRFHVVFVGSGKSDAVVRRAVERHEHLHWVGQRFGDDRAPYFAMADALLLPGAVGLAVLDAFAVGMPVISSTSGDHGPEIAYLDDGVNALVVDDDGDPCAYGEAVLDLLADAALRDRLRAGARQTRATHTVERMVTSFADGIMAALATR